MSIDIKAISLLILSFPSCKVKSFRAFENILFAFRLPHRRLNRLLPTPSLRPSSKVLSDRINRHSASFGSVPAANFSSMTSQVNSLVLVWLLAVSFAVPLLQAVNIPMAHINVPSIIAFFIFFYMDKGLIIPSLKENMTGRMNW